MLGPNWFMVSSTFLGLNNFWVDLTCEDGTAGDDFMAGADGSMTLMFIVLIASRIC
jgi:hypothetical protein